MESNDDESKKYRCPYCGRCAAVDIFRDENMDVRFFKSKPVRKTAGTSRVVTEIKCSDCKKLFYVEVCSQLPSFKEIKTVQPLTVRDLIGQLSTKDQDAVVAIEGNGYPDGTVQLKSEGWLSGVYYMKKGSRINYDLFLAEDIPAAEKDGYTKVLVLRALVGIKEAADNGLI